MLPTQRYHNSCKTLFSESSELRPITLVRRSKTDQPEGLRKGGCWKQVLRCLVVALDNSRGFPLSQNGSRNSALQLHSFLRCAQYPERATNWDALSSQICSTISLLILLSLPVLGNYLKYCEWTWQSQESLFCFAQDVLKRWYGLQ